MHTAERFGEDPGVGHGRHGTFALHHCVADCGVALGVNVVPIRVDFAVPGVEEARQLS